MRLTMLALLAATLSAPVLADTLDQASATRLVQDFYQAVKARDEARLSALLPEDAVIRLTLVKNNQSFTLSRADWLQQLRAAAHFGKTPRIRLSDFKLSLTQAGYTGAIAFRKQETVEMLDQTVKTEEDVEADLKLVEDKLTLTGLRIRSSF